jgi:hypothetical protein
VNAPISAEPEIVSKSEFARLSNVSAARMSQWITEKKIYGDALVGDGRNAKINVAVARAQLRQNLDISQRMGNGLSTQLDGRAPAVASTPAAPAPVDQVPTAQVLPFQRPAQPEPVRDPIEEQIKRERLETARRTNRKMAEEEAARNGRYVLAEDVRREIGKASAQYLSSTEGWLAELASKTAAKFSLQQRDVLHLMRSEFRNFRANLSTAIRQQAEALPETIEEELPELEPIEE